MKRGVTSILAAIIVASTANATETQPARIAVTPDSRDAVIVALLPQLRIPYAIGLSAIDPVTGDTKFNVVTGRGSIFLDAQVARPGEEPGASSRFVVDRVKPGTYVVREINQQGFWTLCFHKNTVRFDVGPGQVVLLGRVDAAPAVLDLENRAVATRQTMAGPYHNVSFFDDVLPPPILPVDAPMLEQLASFMMSTMPGTTSKPIPAAFQATTFATGADISGMHRLCAGVFHKRK